MLLKFKSDQLVSGKGFDLSYTSNPSQCGGNLTGTHGNVYMSFYPEVVTNSFENLTFNYFTDIPSRTWLSLGNNSADYTSNPHSLWRDQHPVESRGQHLPWRRRLRLQWHLWPARSNVGRRLLRPGHSIRHSRKWQCDDFPIFVSRQHVRRWPRRVQWVCHSLGVVNKINQYKNLGFSFDSIWSRFRQIPTKINQIESNTVVYPDFFWYSHSIITS